MSISAYLHLWAQKGGVWLERCRGMKEAMRAGPERALGPTWVVEVEGWTESWGLKKLAGVEEEVGEESRVRFLEKTTWAQGGWEEGAAGRSNLESAPQERGEREAGKAEVEAAEGGSMVGEWWCGGSAEQGARWAW